MGNKVSYSGYIHPSVWFILIAIVCLFIGYSMELGYLKFIGWFLFLFDIFMILKNY